MKYSGKGEWCGANTGCDDPYNMLNMIKRVKKNYIFTFGPHFFFLYVLGQESVYPPVRIFEVNID